MELTQAEKDARDKALHDRFYKSQEIKVLGIDEFLDKAGKLGGWFTPQEGQFLMNCVRDLADKEGKIVEIGSFVGKTTSYLSRALLDLGTEDCVYSLDPFIGSIEHQQFIETNTEYFDHGTTFWKFIENLKELGVYEHVIPIAAPSDRVATFWNLPIKILFIDGDHNHKQPHRDYVNFSKFIIDGGMLIFHDSSTPDVVEAIDLAKSQGWVKFYESGVLTAWRRP